MTPALHFRIIGERNLLFSMEMPFFAWNMGKSFFGMPIYILDSCSENWDESNGSSNFRLWLQFIPIFGALHSQLRKGHTIKKDISILFSIFSFSGEYDYCPQFEITSNTHVETTNIFPGNWRTSPFSSSLVKRPETFAESKLLYLTM